MPREVEIEEKMNPRFIAMFAVTSLVASVALGAVMIEKHFTLNKNDDGPDHHMSLNPEELKYFVRNLKEVEQTLGDGI